ncbi:RNA-dependent RNA polymerase 1 [Hordeum vulgare]|nr:RNA-dependent RNA polymerase 1 [Hordeum vulgare]
MAAAVVLPMHLVVMVLLQIQLRLNDEVWEARFHFHERDNLERCLNVDDITFYNLIALIELEGYGMTDFMYYVRDPGVGVSGMEELTDDEKVEEMLDDLAIKGQKVVNITVMRSDAPKPSDLNIAHVTPAMDVHEKLVLCLELAGNGRIRAAPPQIRRPRLRITTPSVFPTPLTCCVAVLPVACNPAGPFARCKECPI